MAAAIFFFNSITVDFITFMLQQGDHTAIKQQRIICVVSRVSFANFAHSSYTSELLTRANSTEVVAHFQLMFLYREAGEHCALWSEQSAKRLSALASF